MDVMYSMYFVFSYFICPVYCSIDTNACQYVRIKKLLYIYVYFLHCSDSCINNVHTVHIITEIITIIIQ